MSVATVLSGGIIIPSSQINIYKAKIVNLFTQSHTATKSQIRMPNAGLSGYKIQSLSNATVEEGKSLLFLLDSYVWSNN